MQPRICIWVSVCVCIYICISVPFVCEVDLENKYSILFYSIAWVARSHTLVVSGGVTLGFHCFFIGFHWVSLLLVVSCFWFFVFLGC